MNLVFSGALAATFYTLVLGAIWPPRDGSDFAASILGLIAKSLWLSWLVVALSYWLDLDVPILALFGAVAACLIYQWLRRGRATILTNAFPVVLVLMVTAALCLFFYLGGFNAAYRMIYVTNDALMSWNRWADELSRNTYSPYDAAYPILFPGIWSLVYKAQGVSTIWIFAKLTMFVVPVIVGATVCLLFSSRLLITGVVHAIFSFWFFFLLHSYPMLQGDMDMPVAAMCMAAGVAMVVAADRMERGEAAGETVVIAALFAGLAAITKQAGVVVLVPLMALIGFGLWRRTIGRLDALIAIVAAGVPLAIFMTMYLAQRPDVVGNIVNLERIRQLAGADPLALAWHHVEGMLPIWMLAILALLAVANVFGLRRLSGWMGILFLALAVAGFAAFAKCCSYDARNGWWIISLLATSALFSVTRLAPSAALALPVIRAPAQYLPTAAAAFAVLAAFMVQDRVSSDEITHLQFQEQEGIAGDMGSILKRSLRPILNRGDVLLTEQNIVRFLPGMLQNLSFCPSLDAPCIRDAFTDPARGRIFVLKRRGGQEYPSLSSLLTADRLMDASGGFELYGPLQAADVQSIDANAILRRPLPPMRGGDVVLTQLPSISWSPEMRGSVISCVPADAACIREVFNNPARGRIFVLVRRGVVEYPSLSTLLTPDKLMTALGGFELYGPFQTADVQSIEANAILTQSLFPIINKGDVLLAEPSSIRWPPAIRGSIALCARSDTKCISDVFNDPARGRIFVLVKPGRLDYPSMSTLLTADKLMAASGGVELYGPLQAADVQSIEANAIVNQSLQPINRGDVLLADLPSVHWMPGIRDTIVSCVPSDASCIRNVFADPARGRIFVLVRRGVPEYPSLSTLLTPDKLMTALGGFELYGPFQAADVQSIEANAILRQALYPIINRGDVLLAEPSSVRWPPAIRAWIALCARSDTNCISKVFNDPARGRIFVLIKPGELEYPSMAPLLTPEKQMAASGGFELYGPLGAADAAAIK